MDFSATRRYRALGPRNAPIITVIAPNKEEASQEIERQLSKPGREAYLALWNTHGRRINLLV